MGRAQWVLPGLLIAAVLSGQACASTVAGAPGIGDAAGVRSNPQVYSRADGDKPRPHGAGSPDLKTDSNKAAAENEKPGKPSKNEEAKSPRRQASMQQVNQARGQLGRGKVDAAIRTLEKAVKIDARNGEAFILLARAWEKKGEKRKALEFAKKAELLFHKQPARLKEVYLLESELYRELGERARTGHKVRPKRSGESQKPSE